MRYTAFRTRHSKKWVCNECRAKNGHLMYDIANAPDEMALFCYRCKGKVEKIGPIKDGTR